MIGDTLKSIYGQLYERATNPFWGSFFIFWILTNYRTLFILFSEHEVTKKFELIDTIIYTNNYDFIGQAIILPILLSLIYIIGFPVIGRPLFEYSREKHVEILNSKKKIDGDILLSKDESRKIVLDRFKLEEEFKEVLDKKNLEIESLKSAVDKKNTRETLEASKEEQEKSEHNNKKVSKEKLDDIEIDVLKLAANMGNYISETSIVNALNLSRIIIKHALGELTNQKYLDNSSEHYKITHKGINYLVRNKLVK